MTVANVGGFNDLIGLNPLLPPAQGGFFPVNCQTCHGMPHAGSEIVFPPQRDLGIGGQATAASLERPAGGAGVGTAPAPATDMPIFEFDLHNGAPTSLLWGEGRHQ